jgi:hypothetical protein
LEEVVARDYNGDGGEVGAELPARAAGVMIPGMWAAPWKVSLMAKDEHSKEPDEFPRDDSTLYKVYPPVRGYNLIEMIAHAMDRGDMRDVGIDDVIKVLSAPDVTSGLDTQESRERFRRNKTGRIAIDVVFEELTNRIRVITVIKIQRRVIRRGMK